MVRAFHKETIMAKEPMNWNKEALGNVGAHAAVGAAYGGLFPLAVSPGLGLAGAAAGAAIGAGYGVAQAVQAKRAKNRNLGRQFGK